MSTLFVFHKLSHLSKGIILARSRNKLTVLRAIKCGVLRPIYWNFWVVGFQFALLGYSRRKLFYSRSYFQWKSFENSSLRDSGLNLYIRCPFQSFDLFVTSFLQTNANVVAHLRFFLANLWFLILTDFWLLFITYFWLLFFAYFWWLFAHLWQLYLFFCSLSRPNKLRAIALQTLHITIFDGDFALSRLIDIDLNTSTQNLRQGMTAF